MLGLDVVQDIISDIAPVVQHLLPSCQLHDLLLLLGQYVQQVLYREHFIQLRSRSDLHIQLALERIPHIVAHQKRASPIPFHIDELVPAEVGEA